MDFIMLFQSREESKRKTNQNKFQKYKKRYNLRVLRILNLIRIMKNHESNNISVNKMNMFYDLFIS